MRQQIIVPVILVVALAILAGTAFAGPQARVSGTVVGTDGAPITGVTVTVTSAELPKYHRDLVTDADGEFKILLLDATKTYLFTAKAEGYIEYNQEIKVMVGTTDNEFTFELSTQKERAQAKQKEIMEQPGYLE